MLKLMLEYFGHLIWKADSLEKTLMLGKIEGKRRKDWRMMKWLGSTTNSMDMNLSKLHKTVKDWGAWHTTVHESYKELDMTEQLNNTNNIHNTKASTSEKWESLSRVWLFAISWTIQSGILQARILEWVDVPFYSGPPNPGIEPRSPLLQADFLSAEPQGKPSLYNVNLKNAIIKCKAGNCSIWSGEKFIIWVLYA